MVKRSKRHYSDYTQTVAKVGRRRRPARDQGDQQQETSSWMVDHHRDQHGDQHPDYPDDPLASYTFFQLGNYRKPLYRQVAEATHIKTATSTGKIIVGKVARKVNRQLMNRKDEQFNFNPRGRQWGRPQGL